MNEGYMMSDRQEPLLNKSDEQSDSQSQSRASMGGMQVQNYMKSEGQMKLDQFMTRFKDKMSRTRERNENYKKGLFDSDSEDDAIPKQSGRFGLDGLLGANAPKDAHGNSDIQSLEAYVEGVSKVNKNPKNAFFELSRNYYNSKYDKDNKKKLIVRSYLITEDHENFVRDLSMDIIQTNQGCMPIIKTFEQNAYHKKKFVKALKFYNYRTDCKLKKQFIVDEGVMDLRFKTKDTSILHFGNSIIFYLREENWHKLKKYDVVKNELEELEGYTIEEPIGQEIRYHVMFSLEFGKKRNREELAKKKPTLEEFLAEHFVICQSYRITENLEYINMPMVMWKLDRMGNNEMIKPASGSLKTLPEAIQYVGHIKKGHTGAVTFLAIDSFSVNEFDYDPETRTYSDYRIYTGLNELQIRDYQFLKDSDKTQEWKHENLSPFYKHQHPQFLIQKDKIKIIMYGKEEEVDQYYYMTHDNQFMLIYPNYPDNMSDLKKQVIFQIARKHQYNQSADEDYNYQDDLNQRQKDYFEERYKKISHVCSDNYRSKNHMKRSEHLRMILEYPVPLDINHKLILSTDQERSNIYVYKSNNVSGENEIEIYNYENNIAYSNNVRTLPQQIEEIREDQLEIYGPPKNKHLAQMDNETFYVNAKYRHVVSSMNHIKTSIPEMKQEGKKVTHQVNKKQQDLFIVVEKAGGEYINIKVKNEHLLEKVKPLMYQKTRQYYVFFFSLRKEDKHSYFAVRKTVDEVMDLGNDNSNPLIKMEQKITIITENDFVGQKESELLPKYTQEMTFKELIDLQKEEQTWNINLTFELCYDNRSNINFIPFIYQEKKSLKTHHLCVFDLEKMRVVKHFCINSNKFSRRFLRYNDFGFAIYTITRTSDVFTHREQNNVPIKQLTKYAVGAQFYLPEEGTESARLKPNNPSCTTTELNEYVITYNQVDKNRIQLMCKKQLLLSDTFQARRNKSFDDVFILPYFDKNCRIKGAQLVLQEDGTVIYMQDQDLNNTYQHNSEMLQYGYQKFLTNEDSHDEYILLVSCQFKQRVYMTCNIENSEAYYILNKIQKKLLSMQLAKFEYFVLNDDFDALMRGEFFQTQEVLAGKTICELCLNFPREINYGLKQPAEVQEIIDGSLMEEVTQADEDLLNFYENMGLCEKNLICQVDFNFVTTLRLAMTLHSNQTVKLLLQKIFELNDPRYQDIFMLDLPTYLDQPIIKRMYDFFERDTEEKKLIELKEKDMYKASHVPFKPLFCNFEDFTHHPKLPAFSNARATYHLIEKFKDMHNYEGEVLEEVITTEPEAQWGVDTGIGSEKNYEIEHSYIDFQKVIIGEKIRAIQEENFKNINFGDQQLANVMHIEDDEHIEFYNLESIRKVIDFQFMSVSKFLVFQLAFYVIGFVAPFIVSMEMKDSTFVVSILYNICLFTQVFFIMFECIQLRQQRLDYFCDIWNIIDVGGFISFVTLYVNKQLHQFESDTQLEQGLTGIVLVLAVNKCFYFLRYHDGFRFLFIMLTRVVGEIFSFAAICISLLIGFTVCFETLHMSINDPNGDYDSIHNNFVKQLLQLYKSTQGQKNTPTLSDSFDDKVKDNEIEYVVSFGFLMIVWLVSSGLFSFIGTMFLAQITQAFEKHYARMRMYSYQCKAQFNQECFQIMEVFQRSRRYKILVLGIDKKIETRFDGEYQGLVEKVKKDMDASNQEASEQRKATDEQTNVVAKNNEIAAASIDSANSINQANLQAIADLQKLMNSRRCCCEFHNRR